MEKGSPNGKLTTNKLFREIQHNAQCQKKTTAKRNGQQELCAEGSKKTRQNKRKRGVWGENNAKLRKLGGRPNTTGKRWKGITVPKRRPPPPKRKIIKGKRSEKTSNAT